MKKRNKNTSRKRSTLKKEIDIYCGYTTIRKHNKNRVDIYLVGNHLHMTGVLKSITLYLKEEELSTYKNIFSLLSSMTFDFFIDRIKFANPYLILKTYSQELAEGVLLKLIQEEYNFNDTMLDLVEDIKNKKISYDNAKFEFYNYFKLINEREIEVAEEVRMEDVITKYAKFDLTTKKQFEEYCILNKFNHCFNNYEDYDYEDYLPLLKQQYKFLIDFSKEQLKE